MGSTGRAPSVLWSRWTAPSSLADRHDGGRGGGPRRYRRMRCLGPVDHVDDRQPSTSGTSSASPSSVSTASTSTRGITANSINVVFPVVSLNSLAGKEGFASDPEYAEQTKAINFYVTRSTTAGGSTAARSIRSSPPSTPPTSRRCGPCARPGPRGPRPPSRCWTGSGTGPGTISSASPRRGTRPSSGLDDGHQLDQPGLALPVVDRSRRRRHPPGGGQLGTQRPPPRGGPPRWGSSPGTGPRTRLPSTSTSFPTSATPASPRWSRPSPPDPSETATTDTQSPLVIQQLRSAGVTSIIPLIPFNVFYPVLQAETSQNYFPKLLLSDYEESIESALGLIPIPYEKALDGQEGLTTQTLGGGTNVRTTRGPWATTPG